MINWNRALDQRPEDGQSCFITAVSGGLASRPIVGPITYNKEGNGWLDLFATPEAGSMFPVAGENVPEMWWCPEASINLPE